jgi:site-specific DNA-cytosine methylase
MVAHFKPKALFFENVRGSFCKTRRSFNYRKKKQSFDEIGYYITDNLREDALFDTSYYNIPQKEKDNNFRVIKSQK